MQNPEGLSLEVKWSAQGHRADAQLASHRKTLARAARKRKLDFDWKDKPKVPVREARPDKNRRFFGWKGEGQGLGVVWYCRGCGRVVFAQVAAPASQETPTLAATILSTLEDHGEDGEDLWALYGCRCACPAAAAGQHQLMAGYTMLQFRQRERLLRAERWALANVALKEACLEDFLWDKCRKFWRDYRLQASAAEWAGHPGVFFAGRTRKVVPRLVVLVRRLICRPGADRPSARAWHCATANKIFALHAVHPEGDLTALESAVQSVTCH